MSNLQPKVPAQQTPQLKSHPIEDKQKAKLLMARFTPLNDYLKNNQDMRENLAVMFAEGATFKQTSVEMFDTEEKKKNYFHNQWSRIVFTAIYLMDTDFANFDQFSIQFFSWLLEENIKFPIKKEELKLLHDETAKKKAHTFTQEKEKVEKQKIESEIRDLQDKEQRKRKEIQRIDQQNKQKERKLEQEKRQQLLLQRQKQLEIQKQKIKQSYERNPIKKQMVDEGQEKQNSGRMTVQKIAFQPRPPQRSTSPARENKFQTPQININNPNAGNHNYYKNQNKSPLQSTGQRFAEGDYRQRNEPIYVKNELTKEEMVKRILGKICDCHECPEKRVRILGQIKGQLDNLRKLEQVERNDRNFKIEKK